jgi:hypothetical protein
VCYLWEKEFCVEQETKAEFQRVVGDDNPNRVGSWMARLNVQPILLWSLINVCYNVLLMI